MAKRKGVWPGPETKPLYRGKPIDSNRIVRDGEPLIFDLEKFPTNEALTVEEWSVCCDCGLRHLIIYEVFEHNGRFHLALRCFRDPDSGKKRRKK